MKDHVIMDDQERDTTVHGGGVSSARGTWSGAERYGVVTRWVRRTASTESDEASPGPPRGAERR